MLRVFCKSVTLLLCIYFLGGSGLVFKFVLMFLDEISYSSIGSVEVGVFCIEESIRLRIF